MILWALCPLSISLCNQHPPFDEPRFTVTEPLNGCGTNRYQEYRPWFPILRRLVTVRATLGETSRNFLKDLHLHHQCHRERTWSQRGW